MLKLLILFLLLPLLVFSQNVTHLKLSDIDGKTVVMKEHLKAPATVIVFWATWCIPCKKEFPAIQKLQEKYPEEQLQVITISRDTPRSLAKLKAFIRTHSYQFVYLLDATGEVSSKLLVNTVPFTMLVDKSGKVLYTRSGYRKGDEAELEQQLLRLWNQTQNTK